MIPDPLQVLVDALAANAVSFRRIGRDGEAQQAEWCRTRLLEALARAA